jgi:hypothetical protein
VRGSKTAAKEQPKSIRIKMMRHTVWIFSKNFNLSPSRRASMRKAYLNRLFITQTQSWKVIKYTSNYRFVLGCALSIFLCSCATTSFPVLGIRPDHPQFAPSSEARTWCGLAKTAKVDDCTNYRNYVEYATNLSAAYRSRATLNEWGLYFAGLVGLSGLTATAGLAATNAGIQALRIVPLVSGFVSGVTAVTENKEKSLNYTRAANTLDDAISEANIAVATRSPDYSTAFANLSAKVTKAKNDLELSRSDLAGRDKHIEDLVDNLIRKRLPSAIRLSDDDVDVAVNQIVKVDVEDGGSVDPTRTSMSKKDLVDVSYENNNQTISIKGVKAGTTLIKFRNKEGIGASVVVNIK